MAVQIVLPFYVETWCIWCGAYGGGEYETIEQARRDDCDVCGMPVEVVNVEHRRDRHVSARGR